VLDEILAVLTFVNVVLVFINTYWAWQRTCYNRDVYYGSKEYWNSWKKRSKDVARMVLKEIDTSDLEKELRRRHEKKKGSRRA